MGKQTTMKGIIEQDLKPIVFELYKQIKEKGIALELDGIPAYNSEAQFVGGMVINMCSFVAVELIKTEECLEDLGDIIRMAAGMEMNTWGILGSLSGLYRLHTKELLGKVVDEETLSSLKKSLDWRSFVDVENQYALTDLPTNYYGVAFNIARYRELLGWEPEAHSTYLLNHLLEHINRYSGNNAFMDETDGEGRFDRYSIVLPGELASSLLDAGAEVPAQIHTMLDKSAHLLLQLANEEGQGICYGRSIGAFGETAVLGIFTTAAKVGGIFTEEELEIAYGYSMKVMKRVIDFWYDKDMKSINMWDHGRRTDSYRNKNRILSETLGIFLNLMGNYESWKRLGFEDREICPDFNDKLDRLNKYTYITFAEGEYKRGLAIVRDKKQVWMLPLVGGGFTYYDKDAYMPVPFQNQVLQGVAGWNHGQLVPQLLMENGEVYMPITYTTEIVPEVSENRMSIICKHPNLRCMGRGIYVSEEKQTIGANGRFEKADGVEAEVRYTFEKGQIRREDIFTIAADARVKEVRLVLLTYSEKPEVKGYEVNFGEGTLTRMRAEGYDTCSILPAVDDGSYDTPQGRLNYEAVWTRKIEQQAESLKFSWTIEYAE